jgi:4-hydroxy-3-polyprenylbenzoate decarboxylase/2,5-furandicarboxylate decarboxylase 1
MDFRSFLELLDSRGEVLRVKKEVHPKFELASLLAQAEKRRKAIVFENVAGASCPASGASLLTRQRHALGIGRDEHFLDDRDAYQELLKNAWDNPLPTATVVQAPVHEVVIIGDDIDMTRLPVPWFFDGDSHPFITAGLGLAADPDTGFQNLGFYRVPILDAKTITVGASRISNLRRIYDQAIDKGGKMPIAIAIGAPPCMYLTAASQAHPGNADLEVAGAIQQQPIEVVKAQTSDLLVPARAEFVIEAEVDFSTDVDHVMGEYGDSYGNNTSPIARVTAITHRTDPVFQVINAGMTPEHNNLGAIMFSHLRRELLEYLQQKFPCVTDVHIDGYPPHGGARSRGAIAIRKTNDDQPQQILDAVYDYTSGRFPIASVLQRVVVVDDDVDITRSRDVQWAIGSRLADPSHIAATESGGIVRKGVSMRLCIDATVPLDMRAHSARPTFAGTDQYDLDQYL